MPAMEDGLFEEWRKRRPALVRDGVIDEEEYLGSDLKLLFLLGLSINRVE